MKKTLPPTATQDHQGATHTENREQRQTASGGRNLSRLKQFTGKYPAFTENSIRWLIFNRETNGFAECFLKVGKYVLIDEDRFFDKVEETRMG